MPEAVTTLSIYRRQEQPREGCRRMPDGNTLAACRSSSWPGTRSFPKGSTDPTKKLFNGHILLCSPDRRGHNWLHKMVRQSAADASSFLSLKVRGKVNLGHEFICHLFTTFVSVM